MAQWTRHTAVGISLGIAAFLLSPTTHAFTKCEGGSPKTPVDVRACAAAAESPDALRQFVARTRMIYALYIWDYATESDGSKAAVIETREPRASVASREAGSTPTKR